MLPRFELDLGWLILVSFKIKAQAQKNTPDVTVVYIQACYEDNSHTLSDLGL